MLAAPRVGAATSDEYKVKAVFLFNFAQFVDWPEKAFADPKAPLVIGVLGQDPFGTYLDEVVQGEKVGLRPIVIRRFHRVDDVGRCHILFISRSEAPQLARVIARLDHRAILTVGDADVFNRVGGMVRFVTENGKIRLRINPDAAKACDLIISSKILRPATIVANGGD